MMTDWLEIQFWKVAKWLIIRGYGPGCKDVDIDDKDFLWKDEEWTKSKPSELIRHPGRCSACRAKEVLDWIDYHLEILK